jgi:hypothetical protein
MVERKHVWLCCDDVIPPLVAVYSTSHHGQLDLSLHSYLVHSYEPYMI